MQHVWFWRIREGYGENEKESNDRDKYQHATPRLVYDAQMLYACMQEKKTTKHNNNN